MLAARHMLTARAVATRAAATRASPYSARPFSSTTIDDAMVLCDVRPDDGIAVVTLNRPKALNALCGRLMHDLREILVKIQADSRVRAVVVTGGTCKAFAAGADIKEMNARSHGEVVRSDMLADWGSVLRATRKPVIAAVNGFALGGGCEMAMMCDIIVASEAAKFGQPEILLGTIPGAGGTQRLVRAVGKSKAMELVLTGRTFSAAEAERIGLVSEVVAHDALQSRAAELAKKIATFSGPAVESAKECVDRSYEMTLAEGCLAERRAFHATWSLADRAEGMAAFEEKRAPKWQHK